MGQHLMQYTLSRLSIYHYAFKNDIVTIAIETLILALNSIKIHFTFKGFNIGSERNELE